MTFRRISAATGALVVLLAATLGSSGTLSADNGPHVAGAGATTDSCASCHRSHTASAEKLLVESQPGLCYSCHGTGGTGASTIVQDGKLYGEGESYTALKAGGFDYALIDTDSDFYPGPSEIYTLETPEPVTSRHTIDGTVGTLWGNGAIGSGPGTAGYNLRCGACHDPHGNGQYRILRSVPVGSGAATGVSVTDEDVNGPTPGAPKDYDTTNYLNVWYVAGDEISAWCSQCHTRYLSGPGAGHTDSGDPIFAYQHLSDGSGVYCGACHAEYGQGFIDHELSCIKCHASHGTNATMSGAAALVEWPDGTVAPAEDPTDSRLLKMNNRGICQKCHNK